jgi:hypothetical protein
MLQGSLLVDLRQRFDGSYYHVAVLIAGHATHHQRLPENDSILVIGNNVLLISVTC